MVFAGDQVLKRLLKPLLWNPAPRLGFAYKLDSKTVVRAAIGIFNGNYTNNSNGIPSTGFRPTSASRLV
ncbi:MAG: hypothetical protein R2724_11815 [Bryobacterales bacterium]